ncbi:MAG: hypothetical protein IJA81_07205 [Akkermansia sp.]|nr:hypothetical protein [Akkermansia sp.]MBQ9096378.1 hypothetical protein [Akkermansia sp.]
MKNSALMITAMASLSLCMVACSDKKEEAAPAPAAKVLTTAEDYLDAQAAMSEQLTALLASVTPENSAAKAAEVKALIQKGNDLEKEMEAKGIEITEEIMAKYEAKREEAQNKLLEQLTRLMGMADKLDPSFMEAMKL